MITFDFSGIERNLANQLKASQQLALDKAAKIAFDIDAGLKVETPVDTNEARSGWQLDLSNPSVPTITNNVAHIAALNDGHSNQAPAGFVEAVVDKAVRAN